MPFALWYREGDKPPRLFASEESFAEWWVVAKKAKREEKCVIPTNMRVEPSVICSLFEADGERGAANREDLSMWSDS